MIYSHLAQPLDPRDARRRMRRVLREGSIRYSRHAIEEMRADGLTTLDCERALRGGWVEPGEPVRGTWRYRVRIPGSCFVIAFGDGLELTIVTAWRD